MGSLGNNGLQKYNRKCQRKAEHSCKVMIFRSIEATEELDLVDGGKGQGCEDHNNDVSAKEAIFSKGLQVNQNFEAVVRGRQEVE